MTGNAQAVLRERARLLARRPPEQVEQRVLLTWQRGAESFALELNAVRAVVPTGAIAVVPLVPPPLAGMVAFRGSLLPVYDPRPLLAAASRHSDAADQGTWTIVVNDPAAPFGLLSDELPDIVEVRDEELRAPSGDLPSEARRCIQGITRSGSVLLAGEALAADPRLHFSPITSPPETPQS